MNRGRSLVSTTATRTDPSAEMMYSMVFYAAWSACVALPLSNAQGLGPFEIDFRALEQCDGFIKNPMVYNTKYSKIGRKKVSVSFDLYAPHGINDDIIARLDIAIKTQNGFKHNYLNMEGPMLTSLKTYAAQYYKMIKHPILPGNYSVKNQVVEVQSTLIKSFFYNTYKIIVNFVRKKEKVGCVDFIVDLVPKKKQS